MEETVPPAPTPASVGLPRRIPENAQATLAKFAESSIELRYAQWLADRAGPVRSLDGENRSPASSDLSYLKHEPYTSPVRTVL